MSRQWRGNVRELQNVIEHVAVFATANQEITIEDLPGEQDQAHSLYASDTPVATPRPMLDTAYHVAKEEILARFEQEYVTRLVARAKGNVSRAARLASMDRTTLYRLMERQGFSRGAEHVSVA